MNVHQILSGAGPVDAVTNQARFIRSVLGRWGWGGGDHAVSIDPRSDDAIKPLRGLQVAAEDLLLLHYSAYAPKLRDVLALPNRKLLLSHNVTPAGWFWDHDPATAVRCALGRRHLPEFVAGVDMTAAVSEFNAGELEAAGASSPRVIPVLFDPDTLGAPTPGPPDGPPEVLFVGRLTPHKRQDEILRAFALYRRHRAPEARLTLVGEPLNERYARALRDMADELAPGAVRIEHGLSGLELGDRYRRAHVFLCLSEHEGFCVPLLEAFHHGVAIIARPVGGVPEVAGDAALLVEDGDLAVVSELIHLAATDGDLRAQLRQRGHARVTAFSASATEQLLRSALEDLAAMGEARPGPESDSSRRLI